MVFRYPRHPQRLGAKHPRIIEDLLELVQQGRQEAINAMINMLVDVHEYGLESRFVKKLKGLPVWELKTKSRGGLKGGARIYFFVTEEKEAALVNAEVKDEEGASIFKLEEVLDILEAYMDGILVLDERSIL